MKLASLGVRARIVQVIAGCKASFRSAARAEGAAIRAHASLGALPRPRSLRSVWIRAGFPPAGHSCSRRCGLVGDSHRLVQTGSAERLPLASPVYPSDELATWPRPHRAMRRPPRSPRATAAAVAGPGQRRAGTAHRLQPDPEFWFPAPSRTATAATAGPAVRRRQRSASSALHCRVLGPPPLWQQRQQREQREQREQRQQLIRGRLMPCSRTCPASADPRGPGRANR